MRVLVVEDEVDLAEAVALGLRRQGYAVDVALTGSEAVDKLAANGYDVVCLDWNLPDLSGRAICEQLGDGGLATLEGERPRVLMLTARDAIEDRVAGLDAGADDYLVKPFAFSELTARVRALLRREDRRPLLLRVGDLELDPVRHLSTRSGIELDLTPKEFALLHYFISRPGEVLSQETLLEHVWDEMADPFTNTVRVTVSNLRKKLAGAGRDQPIETVPGKGYVLRGRTP